MSRTTDCRRLAANKAVTSGAALLSAANRSNRPSTWARDAVLLLPRPDARVHEAAVLEHVDGLFNGLERGPVDLALEHLVTGIDGLHGKVGELFCLLFILQRRGADARVDDDGWVHG